MDISLPLIFIIVVVIIIVFIRVCGKWLNRYILRLFLNSPRFQSDWYSLHLPLSYKPQSRLYKLYFVWIEFRRHQYSLFLLMIIFFCGVAVPFLQFQNIQQAKELVAFPQDSAVVETPTPHPTQIGNTPATILAPTAPSPNAAAIPAPSDPSPALATVEVTVEVTASPATVTANSNREPTITYSIAQQNILDLIMLGLISLTLGVTSFLVVSFILRQPRYIVTPFKYSEKDASLLDMSTILSSSITTNLREIGQLLTLRQTETIQVPLENPLTFFVSSSQDSEIVDQLSALSDIEAGSFKVPLGKFFAFVIQNIAHTRISGSIIKSKDGSIEVRGDVYRGRHEGTIEFGRVLIPSDPSSAVNEQHIRNAAKDLAVRLAFGLGQLNHIASIPENLQLYLEGLRATKQRKWLYAYSSYLQWTQAEETIRGAFGLGHFYLGTTLLSQGEPERALYELQIAEASGHVLAETQYTIALVLLAQNANELHINDNVFAEIKERANFALSLRNDFFEAQHLIGITNYQRSKLLERNVATAKASLESAKHIQERTKYDKEIYDNLVNELLENKGDNTPILAFIAGVISRWTKPRDIDNAAENLKVQASEVKTEVQHALRSDEVSQEEVDVAEKSQEIQQYARNLSNQAQEKLQEANVIEKRALDELEQAVAEVEELEKKREGERKLAPANEKVKLANQKLESAKKNRLEAKAIIDLANKIINDSASDILKLEQHLQNALIKASLAKEHAEKEFISAQNEVTRLNNSYVDKDYYYDDARKALNSALEGYQSLIFDIDYDSKALAAVLPDAKRLLRDYFMVKHHLGDVERSLKQYDSATKHFITVWKYSPDDLRSFIDLLMTYCLDGKWTQVLDTLTKEVTRQYTLWHADANLYWGWAESGIAPSKTHKKNHWMKALARLDFALSLRPRFILPRRQTLWTSVWKPQLKSINVDEIYDINIRSTYLKSLPDEMVEKIARIWLAWRIHSINVFEKHTNVIYTLFPTFDSSKLPDDNFKELYKELRITRWQIAKVLYNRDKDRRFYPASSDRLNEKITQLLKVWESGENSNWPKKQWISILHSCKTTEGKPITFKERWDAALCIESISLICKLYAENQNWNELISSAKEGREIFAQWFNLWIEEGSSIDRGQQIGRFSPHTIRYHYIAICCWEIYGYLMQGNDVVDGNGDGDKHKSIFEKLGGEKYILTISVLEEIVITFQQHQHPLYLFVLGRYLQSKSLERDAISHFSHLLRIISPFDPKTFDRHQFLPGNQLDRDLLGKEFKDLDLRTKLLYAERVTGQQMFDFLIGKPQVNVLIARCYESLGDLNAATNYMRQALESSQFDDFDLKCFFYLANYLLKLDRFEEALAVVLEARSKYSLLKQNQLLEMPREWQFQVIQCVILTRLKRYDESLILGQKLLQQSLSIRNDGESEHIEILGYFRKLINEAEKETERIWKLQNSQESYNIIISSENETLKTIIEKARHGSNYEIIRSVCDLLNNITYTLVKFDLTNEKAAAHVLASLSVTSRLPPRSRFPLSYDDGSYEDVDQSLSQYNDTLAWIYYRKRTEINLQQIVPIEEHKLILAEKHLIAAIQKNFGSSISHFHLARVYISIYETLWNWGPDSAPPSNVDGKHKESTAAIFNIILSKASFYCDLSQRFDKNKRLNAELRSLRERISRYSEYLNTVQTKKLKS
ncbi:MAG: hypothetical protein H6672_08395 [Anaerolineaceae bacterium]|nr:hypothetical protein [Anaerolineaceae bacterium]